MLGVPSPLAGMAPPANTQSALAHPAPAPSSTVAEPAPAAASPAAPQARAVQKTMLGMMSPLLAQSASPAQPAAELQTPMKGPPKPAAPAPQHTMLGLPQGDAPVVPQAHASKTPVAVPTNRTMLGMTPLATPAVAPASSPRSQQTLLDASSPLAQPSRDAQAAVLPPSARSTRNTAADDGMRARSFTPVPGETSNEEHESVVLPARRGLFLVFGLVVLAALVLGGVSAWLALRTPDIAVRVVTTDTGDALEVEVPGSVPLAKVRFAGEERALTAGRVRFPLRADSLAIGENQLALSVVEPGGKVASSTVRIVVEYRVRAELEALAANPPGLDVVVDALPSSQVTLDGVPLALDARGHGVKRYPVAPQTGGSFDLRARYRIVPPGGAEVHGEVHVTLPVTSVQIDRPGPELVTDEPLVEVAGAVEAQAQVFVDGHMVPVHEGRFLHRAKLAEPGQYKLPVVARAPNKAPRVIELGVQRVADLTMAAASFKYDPSITYARIQPNPLIYKGQQVAFDGRVYNVEVQGGRSVLQMLVLDCPGASRCPLWVEYAQATEATVDSWVRVLGTVAGEQQFRSKQGQVQSVPSVQAQYVLKLLR